METVMSITYWKADVAIEAVVSTVIAKWHQDLQKAEVKIGIIMCSSDKEEVPALKHGGYPALATIKIVPLKDRISKNYDAEMMIDARFWADSTEERRVALVDHELCHVRLKEPSKGQENVKTIGELSIVYDDINRPLIRTVPGDWNIGDGFEEVVKRHGLVAHEVTSVKCIGDRLNYLVKTKLDD